MSNYSYIKTVFPKFEQSKVYNDKLYNDLSITPVVPPQSFTPPQQINKLEPSPVESHPELYDYKTNAIIKPLFTTPETKIETLENSGIKYYNAPLINNDIPYYNYPLPKQEGFQNQEQHSGCSNFMKHINKCEGCRILMIKQFNIESDRMRNEEFMELISYIMFGVFVLLLIDQLKK